MGWLSGWAKRIKITVDADLIDAALSNFPVPVYISAASGIGDVDASCVFDELMSDANRKKIAVTTDDGETQCYVECERWDHANEQAWLHVGMPSVSESADPYIYLYYDSAQADNTTYVGDTGDAAAQSVWDSNFVAVYHMAADPSSSLLDSVGDHNATSYNLSTADQVETIPPGRGLDFDGSSEYANTGINTDFSELTIEVLTSSPSAPANRAGGDGPLYRDKKITIVWDHESATYRGKVTGDFSGTWPALSLGSLSGSTIYHLAASFAAGALTAYNAGAQTDQVTGKTITSSTTTNYCIAKHDTGAYYYQGNIYEVRISNTARSAAWLKATYHGLFDSLLTFSGEEILILAEITDAAALGDTLDALHLAEILTDGVGLGDDLDGYYLREAITDGVGLGDTFDPLHLVETITDGAGLGDALAREIEAALSIADGAGLGDDILAYDLRAEITDAGALNDTISRTAEYYPVLTDALAAGDSFSCLNWSEWLRLNSGQALKRFYFTLTGDGETPAVADAVIPISSFQARLRQGEPTYLSVVIPDLDTYSAIVSARSHGEMVIEMALILDGVEAVREEICRVTLEDINIYEGARSKSITLSGHATETYTTKITALTGASYYNLSGGLRRYRCAMDPYLKPGDTVRVNSEEFEVGYITISRSVGSETMEVVEAES